ncbi:hypothetical protein GF312_15045 [Candidatus Poribacteria bacterium]|nr:hypothetical protein [Candidatus Poribacteria bacterium]
MKKIIGISFFTLILTIIFSINVMANAMGNENYHGENGDQPGAGVDKGPGEQNDEMPKSDRTRNKDASTTILMLYPPAFVIMPVTSLM